MKYLIISLLVLQNIYSMSLVKDIVSKCRAKTQKITISIAPDTILLIIKKVNMQELSVAQLWALMTVIDHSTLNSNSLRTQLINDIVDALYHAKYKLMPIKQALYTMKYLSPSVCKQLAHRIHKFWHLDYKAANIDDDPYIVPQNNFSLYDFSGSEPKKQWILDPKQRDHYLKSQNIPVFQQTFSKTFPKLLQSPQWTNSISKYDYAVVDQKYFCTQENDNSLEFPVYLTRIESSDLYYAAWKSYIPQDLDSKEIFLIAALYEASKTLLDNSSFNLPSFIYIDNYTKSLFELPNLFKLSERRTNVLRYFSNYVRLQHGLTLLTL